MSDMYKPSEEDFADAERLIQQLGDMAKSCSESSEMRGMNCASLAKAEIEGWLYVAATKGETRQSLATRIADATRIYERDYKLPLPPFLEYQ